ncbi:MAG: Holliday junction resolvase RuvX [Chloroflexota bacterium]|nr:MAG: Holliday junction resolvase RuvX [Chloroflexota bacterium]
MVNDGRILAIDPGEKRLGVALSDPTGTIANPLKVLKHVSREKDAETIAQLAAEHEAVTIVVGQAVNWDGEMSSQGRKAARLAGAIRAKTDIPVKLWNEYGSTQAARSARIAMGVSRQKRSGHLDELAATVILQNYLEVRFQEE